MTTNHLEPRPARKGKWIGAGLIALALVAGWLLFARPPEVGPFVGNRAPAFDLVDLEGRTVSSAELAGEPMFINFWATWCVPCRYEMPEIEALVAERGGEFTMVAVSDESLAAVQGYVEAAGYTFPIYLDPDRNVNQAFLVRAYPTSIFIDSNGIIRAVHVGQLSRAEMERYLDPLIPARHASLAPR